MSTWNPCKPYVYQPFPPDGSDDPRIYGLAGPGTEHLRGRRYTKSEAEAAREKAEREIRQRMGVPDES